MSESEENRIVVENEWHRISKTVKWDEERFSDFVRRFAFASETVFAQYGSNFAFTCGKKFEFENVELSSLNFVVPNEIENYSHIATAAASRKFFAGKSKLDDCYDAVAIAKKSAQFAEARKTLSDTLFEEKRKEFLSLRLEEEQKAAHIAEEAAKKQTEEEQAAMLAFNCERDKKNRRVEPIVTFCILAVFAAIFITSCSLFFIFKRTSYCVFFIISSIFMFLDLMYTGGVFLLRANCKYTVDSVGVIINGYGDASQLTSSEKKTNKKELTIPNIWYGNIVYALGENALKNSLYTKVTVGTNVRIIGENALSDCSQLKCVVLPKSVQKIGLGAFANSPAVLEYQGSREEWEKIEKDKSANFNVRFCG